MEMYSKASTGESLNHCMDKVKDYIGLVDGLILS